MTTPAEITALAERLWEVRARLSRAPGLQSTGDWVTAVADEAATALRALLAEREGMRGAALEEAAKICEQQAVGFLSPKYATNQPLSSFQERFACKECAEAIRAAARSRRRDGRLSMTTNTATTR